MTLGSKKIFKTLILYGLTGTFPSIINILILPFIEGPTKLNAVDFSHIAIIESIVVFGWLIASFSGGNVISRFYYDFVDSKPEFNKFISTFFISIILRGLFLFLLFLFLSDLPGRIFIQPELQSFSVYGPIAIIIGINRSLNTALTALLRNQKKVFFYTIFNISTGLLRGIGQVVGLFFIEMSFKGYLYGIFISSLITGVFILVYILYSYGVNYHRQIFKQINQFAIPIFYYELILWIMTYADRYLLEKYPVNLGLYETVTRFALGIRMIIHGFNNAVQPEIYGYFKSGIKQNEKSIRQVANIFILVSQVLIISSIIPVMLYLYYFCDSNIQEAYSFVPIIITLLILKSQFMVFTAPVLYFKDTKMLMYTNIIGAILAISINILLIPHLKIYAPLLAIGISDFFIILCIKHIETKKYNINWNQKKIFYSPIIIVIIAGLLELIKVKLNINPFIISFILITIFIMSIGSLYRGEITTITKKILLKEKDFTSNQKY
jgi:O-antigen/teichoic acid export membrane protein